MRFSKEEILHTITPMIAKRLRVEESSISLGARFKEDMGADSIDLVELVMTLEAHFKVEFSDERLEELQTVQQAVDYLSDLLAAKG